MRDRASRLSARGAWLLTFAPLAALYLFSMRTDRFYMSPDNVAVAPSAWSLAHSGTPVVAKSLWPTLPQWAVYVDPTHVVTTRTPGLVALAAPLYVIWPWAGASSEVPASVVAALITAAAMATLMLVLRRLVTTPIAVVAALIAGVATTTWTVSGTALWPHGPDQLFLAIAMLGAATNRPVRAGLGFAAAMLVRPPLAIAAAVVGCFMGWARSSVRPVIVVGALTAAGLGAFLLYAKYYWHSAGAVGDGAVNGGVLSGATVHGYQGSFFDVSPNALLVLAQKMGSALVAPDHGILPNSPFLLALLPGLFAAWRRAPAWVRSSAIGGFLYFVIQMKSEVWNGGSHFWGYRYPIETLTLMTPLLVLAWRHWAACTVQRRAVFWALTVLSVTLQTVGATHFVLSGYNQDWQFANLTAALGGSLFASIVFLVGMPATLVIYLLVVRQSAGRRCSTSPAPTASTCPPTSTCSRPS